MHHLSSKNLEILTETAQDEEEIIIAAEGSEKDITAAVEAREGAGVTLEEIQPTQSERRD